MSYLILISLLYVLMNWLPTYFEKGLQLSLEEMGFYKIMIPFSNMFVFSNVGGVIADQEDLICDWNQEAPEHHRIW